MRKMRELFRMTRKIKNLKVFKGYYPTGYKNVENNFWTSCSGGRAGSVTISRDVEYKRRNTFEKQYHAGVGV